MYVFLGFTASCLGPKTWIRGLVQTLLVDLHPQTLNCRTYALNLKPYALKLRPKTQDPKPKTQNPKPKTRGDYPQPRLF